MHRRRLDQTAFGFAFVKTCVAHVPDIVIEYMRIPQKHEQLRRQLATPTHETLEPRRVLSHIMRTPVDLKMFHPPSFSFSPIRLTVSAGSVHDCQP